MILVFWATALLIVTHYLGLPVILFLAAKLFPRPHKTWRTQPSVALIIAAYNEERVIARKLQNCRELSYPNALLSVIVVCDGSTDRTCGVVDEIGGATSLFDPTRRGKSHALNRAVATTQADILVFSDANTFYRPDAIANLTRHFGDPTVGGASGLKQIFQKADRASAKGDQTYWNLESLIKQWESACGSISTGDGEIFAIRRGLWRPLEPGVINDDMAITLAIVQQGFRVLYDPEAISEEDASITLREDFNVKARMVAGGYQFFQSLWTARGVPGPFVVQLLVHKFLRYAMPVFLILIFAANLFLLREPFYFGTLLMQITFYVSAGLGGVVRAFGFSPTLFYLPLYYCVVNGAALKGLYYFLRRTGVTSLWSKANR